MAEYTAEDLALIVRYDGTKSAFDAITDKSPYYGRVVFITGATSNGITSGQAIWVSKTGSTSGKYLDMTNIDEIASQLHYVKGLKVGSSNYAGNITIAGSDGISVIATSSNGVVTFTFSGKTLQNTLNTVSTTANSALTKANANGTAIQNLGTEISNIQDSLEGYATDDELKEAINGVVGSSDDNISDMTLHGVREYALSAAGEAKREVASVLLGETNDTLDKETIRGNKTAITAISTAFPVTIAETAGSGDIAKVYTVKQGLNTIGTINIPKELVVTSGSVVAGTWSGSSFTESTTGTGKAIKLTIANQTSPIYIDVKDLVDVYTPQDTDSIDITISTDNKISATVKSSSIQTSMLVNSAVTTAKIADKNVTTAKIADANVTTAKIADNAVTEEKIADAVVAKINLGSTSVQEVSAGDYISVTNTSTTTGTKTRKVSAKIKTIEQAQADSLLGTTTNNALVTADDLYAFLKARLSVKVVS